MQLTPRLTVTRFAQLQPGDSFIYPYGDGTCVALKVKEPDRDMLVLPLGPAFPDGLGYPSLLSEPSATVISFGKDYILRLPAGPEGWTIQPPLPQTQCIVVTEQGAYLRANFLPAGQGYKPCYVALETGAIVTAGPGRSQGFIAPSGHLGFAIEWEILTQEKDPCRILAYPW